MKSLWKAIVFAVVAILGKLFWDRERQKKELIKLRVEKHERMIEKDAEKLGILLMKTKQRRARAKKVFADYFDKYGDPADKSTEL